MSRIRTIKPEWVDDEGLHEVGIAARLLSVALISLADDYGNGRAHPGQLAGRVFWAEDNAIDLVSESLARLSRIRFVTLYTVRGQAYYSITHWSKHQRVDKPGKPRVPGPEEATTDPPTPTKSRDSSDSRDSRDTPGKVPETLAPDRDQDQDPEGDQEQDAREAPPPVSRLSPDPNTPVGRWRIFEQRWLDAFGGNALGLFDARRAQQAERLPDDWLDECDACIATLRAGDDWRPSNAWAYFTKHVGQWRSRLEREQRRARGKTRGPAEAGRFEDFTNTDLDAIDWGERSA